MNTFKTVEDKSTQYKATIHFVGGERLSWEFDSLERLVSWKNDMKLALTDQDYSSYPNGMLNPNNITYITHTEIKQ